MPGWGAKQTYPAVVGTMLVLVGIFTASALLRPLIPPPEPNPVAVKPGGFMAQASRERVRWRTLADQPFAEAKRSDKPVLLVVGCDWNGSGRQFDVAVFGDTDVAERLNREFVPVRIDATVAPEWSLGPYPLTSAAAGIEPGWYVLVASPDGRLVGHLARSSSRQRLDAQLFLNVLAGAQRQAGGRDVSPAEKAMEADRALVLGEASEETGDLSLYAEATLENLTESGRRSGIRSLDPWEWRFLGVDGLSSEESKGLRSLMVAGFVDWLDGGFFRSIESDDPDRIRFEKVAAQDADMTATLAVLAATTKDPFVKKLAERGFDGCMRAFVHAEGVFSSTYAESEILGRAKRYSFKPSLLEKSFTAPEVDFLKSELGLDSKENASMVPRVKDPVRFVERTSEYDALFARLRSGRSGTDLKLGTPGLAGETGNMAARMTEVARVLGDRTRLERALALVEDSERFLSGPDDLQKTLDNRTGTAPCLTDYLAFADAALQAFQASGDTAVLAKGSAVLKRAMKIFRPDRGPGFLSAVPERVPPETPWVTWPAVTDGAWASSTGTALRLLQGYSCVSRDKAEGQDMRRAALAIVTGYGPLTRRMGRRIGCLAHGIALALSDSYLVCVGPDAAVLAFKSSKEAPEAVCIPAVGQVRRDFQGRAPGVYLVRQGVVTGPFGPGEAGGAVRNPP